MHLYSIHKYEFDEIHFSICNSSMLFTIKILNLHIILLYTHLYHLFPVSIHYLQCIHCLLGYMWHNVLSGFPCINPTRPWACLLPIHPNTLTHSFFSSLKYKIIVAWFFLLVCRMGMDGSIERHPGDLTILLSQHFTSNSLVANY